MKIEIPNKIPEHFVENWPGKFEIFSQYEDILGIPHVVYLITTIKGNGLPNVAFGGWSSFWGDKGGFFALLPLMQKTHTFENITRDKEFCINFINLKYVENCWDTIKNNHYNVDELAVGGFTAEKSHIISVPRIAEAFMSLECVLESEKDLSGAGVNSLVIGKVIHAAVDENYLVSGEKYKDKGFMLYFYEMTQLHEKNSGKLGFTYLNSLDEPK